MRRFTDRVFALRFTLVTVAVAVAAAIVPLAALAGGGDPTGI